MTPFVLAVLLVLVLGILVYLVSRPTVFPSLGSVVTTVAYLLLAIVLAMWLIGDHVAILK